VIRHWTDKELAEELKKLTIICDTREQDTHCEEYFKKKKIPCIVRKIDTGDYSAQLGDLSLERDIVVERKHNLDEICGNFTIERERFEREFMRAKAYGTKVHLIVENASWSDIFLGNYRSKLPPKSLVGSLLSWMDLSLWFEPYQLPTYYIYIVLALLALSCWLLVSEVPMFALKFKTWGWRGNEVKYVFILTCIPLLLLLGTLGLAACIAWYVALSLLHRENK
jgi:hypothetical protein